VTVQDVALSTGGFSGWHFHPDSCWPLSWKILVSALPIIFRFRFPDLAIRSGAKLKPMRFFSLSTKFSK